MQLHSHVDSKMSRAAAFARLAMSGKYPADVLTVGWFADGTRKEFSVRASPSCQHVAGEIGGFCTT